VDDALRQAEESLRLNPRSMRLPYSPITLRQSLETLEHEAITVRVLARSMADSTRLPPKENPLHELGEGKPERSPRRLRRSWRRLRPSRLRPPRRLLSR
jgi:hypothetical protein